MVIGNKIYYNRKVCIQKIYFYIYIYLTRNNQKKKKEMVYLLVIKEKSKII